jgi:hypothetical protein
LQKPSLIPSYEGSNDRLDGDPDRTRDKPVVAVGDVKWTNSSSFKSRNILRSAACGFFGEEKQEARVEVRAVAPKKLRALGEDQIRKCPVKNIDCCIP